MAGGKATPTPGRRSWTGSGYTHLSVVPICLDQDPLKTRFDVVDVVVILQRRPKGRGENTQGQFGKSGPSHEAHNSRRVRGGLTRAPV